MSDTADPNEDTTLVRITNTLRDAVNTTATQIFTTGKRCHIRAGGREVKPNQMALLEAAWEVAQRHPGELITAIMRRTEPRAEIGIRADHLATGHRPR